MRNLGPRKGWESDDGVIRVQPQRPGEAVTPENQWVVRRRQGRGWTVIGGPFPTSGEAKASLPPRKPVRARHHKTPHRAISLYLPTALLDAVDEARGDVNRTRYIQRALEEKLERERTTKMSGYDQARKALNGDTE